VIDLKKSSRSIEAIYLHCTATKPRRYVSVATIRDWHVNGRGWSDIGYHYIVQPDGAVELGRDVDIAGAHVKGDNLNTIGVCMVGEWDSIVPDPVHPQERATGELLARLCKLYDINPLTYNLLLHREAHEPGHRAPNPYKSCPGMNITGRLMRIYVNSFYERIDGDKIDYGY